MVAYFEKIVLESASNFKTTIEQKIKDSNRARSNISDPHRRTVLSYPVHTQIFDIAYGKDFHTNEKIAGSQQYKLTSLKRVIDVVGANIKCRPEGDKLLICPWAAVRSNTSNHELKVGRLVIILDRILTSSTDSDNDGNESVYYEVLVPCSGPDDNDEIPAGFSHIPIHAIIPGINLDIFLLTGTMNGATNIDKHICRRSQNVLVRVILGGKISTVYIFFIKTSNIMFTQLCFMYKVTSPPLN